MFTPITPSENPSKAQTIQPWIHAPVVTVALNAPIKEAVDLMHEHSVRRLPVVDGAGRLCGIITTGDVRRADVLRSTGPDLFAIATTLRRATVREVMTERPLVITAETSLCEAARLMRSYKIGALPVVDNAEAVVGIITESDLFDALIVQLGGEAPAVRP